MKKIIRIIFSPIIFLMSFGAMALFPGFICLLLGVMAALENIFKDDRETLDKEHWLFTFAIITYPVINTIQFIKNGKIE